MSSARPIRFRRSSACASSWGDALFPLSNIGDLLFETIKNPGLKANGYFDPSNNQYNAYNYGVDTFPYHSRTNNTVRLDVVLNPSIPPAPVGADGQ